MKKKKSNKMLDKYILECLFLDVSVLSQKKKDAIRKEAEKSYSYNVYLLKMAWIDLKNEVMKVLGVK